VKGEDRLHNRSRPKAGKLIAVRGNRHDFLMVTVEKRLAFGQRKKGVLQNCYK
jgi:hypothetical protein